MIEASKRMDYAPQGQDDGGDLIDWRNELQSDSRMRAVNKLMDILTRLFPFGEGLLQLRRVSIRIEENIYKTATSQSDYLRKIAESMLKLESRQSNGANTGGVAVMDPEDWRNNFPADSRQWLVNKIMDTFIRHFPFAGPVGLQELRIVAIGLEDKFYKAATSQSDYLRKVYMKISMVERDYPLQSNGANTGQNYPLQSNGECEGSFLYNFALNYCIKLVSKLSFKDDPKL